MTYEMDQEKFEEAARSAAAQLRGRAEVAEVVLEPGDATGYRFVILPRGRIVWTTNGPVEKRNYLVILAAPFGQSYDWTGEPGMDAGYAGEKWARSSAYQTGIVVSRFLNALAMRLPERGADS